MVEGAFGWTLVAALACGALVGACSDGAEHGSLTGGPYARREQSPGEPEPDPAPCDTPDCAPAGTPSRRDAGDAGTVDAARDALDAGSRDGATDSGASKDAATDANACIKAVASPGSGHHNAGEDCLSCHVNVSGFKFTVAGTLYAAAASTTPVSGATVEVVDALGKTLLLISRDNGNFYTTSAVTLPLKVRASKCPSDLAMAGAVNNGSCNTTGCHTTGMRIH